MFTITPPAATALANTRDEKGAPETYGVRFFATDTAAPEKASLAFNFVASPQPQDSVVQDGAITAYIAPEVEKMMGDVIVDVDPDGQDDQFVVKRASRQD